MTLRLVTREALAEHPLPAIDEETDKEARGRVLVVGGGRQQPGGAMLAALAALRAGAGKLQIATAKCMADGVALQIPEARVFALPETAKGEIAPESAERLAEIAEKAEAVLLGPGMLDEDACAGLLERLLPQLKAPRLVLDAGTLVALTSFGPALKSAHSQTILTPHAGEMATLMNLERQDVEAKPAAVAAKAAEQFGSFVILKGGESHIVAPGGETWLFKQGQPGLATSGSGDVLAGCLAGLLARGADPMTAAMWGVWAHAEAGARLAARIGRVGYLARELPLELPGVLS